MYIDTAAGREADRLRQEAGAMTTEVYFSADVETDGPIPGPFSMLSFALVYAGRREGRRFIRPDRYERTLYRELKPISADFQAEALAVNGLDRDRLSREGADPRDAMTEAADWVRYTAGTAKPVLVAYPLSFDWSWLYWYFIRFSATGSPFGHSQCYDIKTAYAVKSERPIADSGRKQIQPRLLSNRSHTHHALDDAVEQAEIFANVCEWAGVDDRDREP